MSENRLLIAEDENLYGDFVVKIANRLGFKTCVAERFSKFKDRLSDWGPTAIILDLNMPDADGVECMRQIRDLQSSAKVLVMSGMDQKTLDASVMVGQEFGIDIIGSVQKPVRMNDLRAALQKMIMTSSSVTGDRILEAVDNDELFLVFQPKINLQTSKMSGVEALVRWQRTNGILTPDHFIPIAEQDGAIDRLTHWVLQHGLHQLSEWRREGMEFTVSMNISARNLHDLSLPDTLSDLCAELDVPTDSIILELTETAAMENAATTLDVLTRFRIKGFHLSIDDFGTGYSSLVQLQRLPVSELKIDRAFVMNLSQNTTSRVIAQTVSAMGKSLGLSVTAEGVEDESAVGILREMGCDTGQGYFYSRPIRGSEIPEFFVKNGS